MVLEEGNDFGGISKTVEYKGNRMDMGGHRFFSKSPEVNAWWNHLLPMQGEKSYDDKLLSRDTKIHIGGPDPEKEDRVMLMRNRVSRTFFDNKFYDYPISLKWETIKNMGVFTTIRVGISYFISVVHKRPDDNLANFYINRFGKKLYTMFFEYYTENLWGRNPDEIDASWGAQRVKGLSVIAILKDIFGKVFKKKNRKVETSLIEEFNDVLFSFTKSIMPNPPVSLAISEKEVYQIENLSDIDKLFPDLSPKADVLFVIDKLIDTRTPEIEEKEMRILEQGELIYEDDLYQIVKIRDGI